MNNTICESLLMDMASSLDNYNFDKPIMIDVLETCERLRHKTSVLNRRLLKVKAENRRLRKLLDGLKSIEIEE